MSEWLDELERLEREATPGEWRADTDEEGDAVIWGARRDDGESAKMIGNVGPSRYGLVGVGFDFEVEDARAIAAMRNALPRLLRIARAAGAGWCDGSRTMNHVDAMVAGGLRDVREDVATGLDVPSKCELLSERSVLYAARALADAYVRLRDAQDAQLEMVGGCENVSRCEHAYRAALKGEG